MRTIGLALIAGLALSCSSSPTAPSAVTPVSATQVIAQDAKPDHTPGTLKVTLYFYAPDMGRNVLTGLPVYLLPSDQYTAAAAADPTHSSPWVRLLADKGHAVQLDVPKTDQWVDYYVAPGYLPGLAGASGRLNLPYQMGDNWILLGCDE